MRTSPRPHPGSVEDLVPPHDPHDEASQVVLVGGVEVGHLGRLAPQQRAPVLLARLGHPGDHVGDHHFVHGPQGEIVQEEERPGTLDQDVVHAVVDQVLPHGVVATDQEGHLQLGPHPVGAGDQDRALHVPGHRVQSTEQSKLGEGVFVTSGRHQGLESLLGPLGGVQVDPRRTVVHSDALRHEAPVPDARTSSFP